MIPPYFFEHLLERFNGVADYIEEQSEKPSSEIISVKEQYYKSNLNEEQVIDALVDLPIFRYRFSSNGVVWNPLLQSFFKFKSVQTNQIICAELPAKDQELDSEEIKRYYLVLIASGNVCQLANYR